jgi:protocatechuate 3,4-dioxygenase beta subunit
LNPRTTGVLALLLILVVATDARTRQTQTEAKPVDVEVTVLDAKTRRPLRGVTIYIAGTTARDGAGRTVQTDDDGSLTIKGIAPGRRPLEASRSGYLLSGLVDRGPDARAVYRRFAVQASITAEAPVRLTAYMLRASSVSGTVLDAKGQPVERAMVTPYRYAYDAAGERYIQRFGAGPMTDDRGQFEIDMPPGEYLFRVEDLPNKSRFSPIYYPSSVEAAKADVVRVNPDDDVQLRPFVLQSLPNGTLWVTLQADSKVAIPSNSYLGARRRGDDVDPGSSSFGSNFGSYLRLPQGVYDVEVGAPIPIEGGSSGSSNGALSARVSIEIHDKDVQSTITLREGTKVAGRLVKRDKDGGNSPWAGALVQLTPTKTFNMYASSGFQAFTKTDGTFSFVSVPPDAYQLRVPLAGDAGVSLRDSDLKSAPRGVCVAEIRQDDQAIAGERVNIAGTTTTFSVALAESATRIEGKVVDARGRIADGAVVALIPDDRRQERGFASAATDQSGSFDFKCIPAGNYLIFAWNDLPGAAWRNAEFMAKYADRGTPVRVNEDATVTVQAVLIDQ